MTQSADLEPEASALVARAHLLLSSSGQSSVDDDIEELAHSAVAEVMATRRERRARQLEGIKVIASLDLDPNPSRIEYPDN